MPLGPIAAGDLDLFDKVIAINLARHLYPVWPLAAQHVSEGGRIIAFSSRRRIAKSFPGLRRLHRLEGRRRRFGSVSSPTSCAVREISVNAMAPGPPATPALPNGQNRRAGRPVREVGPP